MENSIDGYFKTKTVWDPTLLRWVCKFCGKEPTTQYVVTGHDHTDYTIDWCNRICGGKDEPTSTFTN